MATMCWKYMCMCIVSVLSCSLHSKAVEDSFLPLSHLSTCTYDYEVSVHAARGAQSTAHDGYQVHALVRYKSFTLAMLC